MDDALFVRGLERVDDLQEHVERARHRHAPLACSALAERLALQPLHHEVRAPVGQHAEREDVDEVRMADLIDRARLVDEALDGVLIGAQPPRDHLDRDLLADERMRGGEHRRHAALAELALDAVLADHRAGAQILFARNADRRCQDLARRGARGRQDRPVLGADPVLVRPILTTPTADRHGSRTVYHIRYSVFTRPEILHESAYLAYPAAVRT